MRYKERSLQLIDVVGRFEARSSADHCYWAISALQRLRADGRVYWKADPQALERWNRACNVLLEFLNTLGARAKQPLATVMREFVQEFEHSVGRMYQLLFSASAPEGEATRERFLSWVEFAYRLSTYAILSSWLEDKTEETTIRTEINLRTGETTQTGSHKPMTVPKKHRKATRSI